MLLIVLLALASNACATTQPVYHAVDGTSFTPTLIPPVSTTEPAVSTAMTPRPPAPDVIIDDVEVTWPPGMEPEATPRPPVAVSKTVAKPAPSTEDLKNQVQNLLAQNNPLQNALDDRRPSKLERYARELASKDAELVAVNALKNKALDEIILLREKITIDAKKLVKSKSLLAATRGGYMQWSFITWNQSQDKTASLRDWIIGGMLSLLVLVVFVYILGLRNGEVKAEGVASERITALKEANEGKSLYIKELRGALVKKNHHIAELEQLVKDGFLSRPSKPLPIEPLAKSPGKKRPRKAKARARPPKKPPVADPLAGPTRAMPTEPAVKVSVEFGSLPLEEPIKG